MDLIWIGLAVLGGLVLAGVVYKNWPGLFTKAVKVGDDLEDKVKDKLKGKEAPPAGATDEAPKKKRRRRRTTKKKLLKKRA